MERYDPQSRYEDGRYDERHYRDHAQRSDSESRTTDLFKQLSRETNDQDMLFNALMLYATCKITNIYMMTMRVVHLADMIMKMRESKITKEETPNVQEK